MSNPTRRRFASNHHLKRMTLKEKRLRKVRRYTIGSNRLGLAPIPAGRMEEEIRDEQLIEVRERERRRAERQAEQVVGAHP